MNFQNFICCTYQGMKIYKLSKTWYSQNGQELSKMLAATSFVPATDNDCSKHAERVKLSNFRMKKRGKGEKRIMPLIVCCNFLMSTYV
jgi:hypothetical protein